MLPYQDFRLYILQKLQEYVDQNLGENLSKKSGVSLDLKKDARFLKNSESQIHHSNAKNDGFSDPVQTSDTDTEKDVNEICKKISNFETTESDATDATTANELDNSTEDNEEFKLEKVVGQEGDEFLYLIEAAKTCLNFEENSAFLQEDNVALDDLKISHEYLDRMFERKGFMINSEIHLILGIFYFRSAQLCAQNKLVATCKLSLNLALVHSEFALATALENNFQDRVKQAQTFHDSFKEMAKDYFDKMNVDALMKKVLA